MSRPKIIVYGKPGCGKCDAAVEKLLKMGFCFIKVDCSDLQQKWLEDPAGASDAMSALQLFEGKYPVIEIDGKCFDYPGAMRKLKGQR